MLQSLAALRPLAALMRRSRHALDIVRASPSVARRVAEPAFGAALRPATIRSAPIGTIAPTTTSRIVIALPETPGPIIALPETTRPIVVPLPEARRARSCIARPGKAAFGTIPATVVAFRRPPELGSCFPFGGRCDWWGVWRAPGPATFALDQREGRSGYVYRVESLEQWFEQVNPREVRAGSGDRADLIAQRVMHGARIADRAGPDERSGTSRHLVERCQPRGTDDGDEFARAGRGGIEFLGAWYAVKNDGEAEALVRHATANRYEVAIGAEDRGGIVRRGFTFFGERQQHGRRRIVGIEHRPERAQSIDRCGGEHAHRGRRRGRRSNVVDVPRAPHGPLDELVQLIGTLRDNSQACG